MENKHINEILEKYWAGESSLEEEAILRKAVHQPDAPESLQSLKLLLPMASGQERLSLQAEDKMEAFFKTLEAPKAKIMPLQQAKVKKLPQRNWLKIAVVGLLLVGIGGIWTARVAEQERIAAIETYEQTKEALALMGMHFKTGEETTLNSIIDASDNLDILN